MFSSRIGERQTFAVEFEGIEFNGLPRAWNEWWGYLWLWAEGRVVGRPAEFEMVMGGIDSLVALVQEREPAISNLLFSRPASEVLDLVHWARYGEDDPPERLVGNSLLSFPRKGFPWPLDGPFFDGLEATLVWGDLEERFVFRQEGNQTGEARWPAGTFKSVVLQARERFQKLASGATRVALDPPRN